MSDPKMLSNLPDGSGLVPSIVDRHWNDLAAGRPGELVPVVALLQPSRIGQVKTKEGVRRSVTYEVVRLEPMRDTHDKDQVAWQVQHAYEKRTSRGDQTTFDFSTGPGEQRDSLLRDIFEWAEDEGATDLDERWLSYFGGAEHAASATVRGGSLVQLMEFGRYIGAVVDAPLGQTAITDEDGEADDPDDPDDDGDPNEQAAALRNPFQAPTDEAQA